MDENEGFRIRWCHRPCKKCYLFSIVLAFLCERAKMIRIRYVYAYLFEEKGGKKNLRFQNYPDTCELSIRLHTVTDHNGNGAYQNS